MRKEREHQFLEVEASEVARLAQETHFSSSELDELRAIIRSAAHQNLAIERDAYDAAVTESLVLRLFERGARVLHAPPRLGVDPIGRIWPKIDAGAAYDVIHASCCRRPDDTIEPSGLLIGLSALCRPSTPIEALHYVFGAFDADKDGHLSSKELAALLRSAYARCALRSGLVVSQPSDLATYADQLIAALSPTGGGGSGTECRDQVVDGQWSAIGDEGKRKGIDEADFSILMASEPALQRWLSIGSLSSLSPGVKPGNALDRVRALANAMNAQVKQWR